jgi:hypothetical protein
VLARWLRAAQLLRPRRSIGHAAMARALGDVSWRDLSPFYGTEGSAERSLGICKAGPSTERCRPTQKLLMGGGRNELFELLLRRSLPTRQAR